MCFSRIGLFPAHVSFKVVIRLYSRSTSTLRCHLDRRDNRKEADGHTGIVPAMPSDVIFQGNEQRDPARLFASYRLMT